MRRVETDPPPATPTDKMWPAIRSRIEAAKVEPLGQNDAPPPRPTRLAGFRRWSTLAAAVVIRRRPGVRSGTATRGPPTITYNAADTGALFTTVSDSARAYEEETRALLNDLELRRSMLRPEAVAAIDHDLRVVDSAIAEVKDALKHDPNNPALQRLLASSYREKLSVLQRVGNAG